jgi:putative ABC transport system ATP-binding protein|tara:strand:- start:11396 stop:12178 length:783 start_codon:yes stop_codon:yes gene_type:complete
MKNKGEEIIQLKNVTKYYKMGESIVKALDGLNLKIKKGEFVAIMGPSGSGKSTAMNLVGSLDVPTRGAIYLDGYDISHLEESDLAQIRGKKVGFIFQQFNLIPNLTVLENVMLPMMFQGTDRMEREEYAMELLRKVDLGDRADHYPNQISGGQMQRVAIARALANDPEVILADEPTGNLDTKTGEKVMEFLEKLNKEGKTIIMVTHEPELAEAYAQVVYWLRDGKIEKVTRKKNGFSIVKAEKELHRKKKIVKKKLVRRK